MEISSFGSSQPLHTETTPVVSVWSTFNREPFFILLMVAYNRRHVVEKVEYKDGWTSKADRAKRIIGVTCLSTLCMFIPAQHSLDQATALYSPEISYELEPESETAPQEVTLPTTQHEKMILTRDTGIDRQPCFDYAVCGTDIAHPFLLPPDENGVRSVGFLNGDTLGVKGPFLKDVPPGADLYRAQTMLRSDEMPTEGTPITFDSAAGLEGKGIAPEILGGQHMLMNDGVSLPNGDIIVSYQHTIDVENPQKHTWYTDRSSLAISHDGGNSFELTGPDWENNADNSDPYQMMSMQLDGDHVYIVSVKAGRQPGPMMLFRARWDHTFDKDAYEYWDGSEWGEKSDAKPIMTGHFGEPSLRKLSDGTWILSYADYTDSPKIVTQMVLDPDQGPEGRWSTPKIQLTWEDLKNLYGGGIHPYSTKKRLILMVSTWQTKGPAENIEDRELVRYDVSHLITSA